jgi:4-hydroxy-4-methyl-2-oxoglutarate aldolase
MENAMLVTTPIQTAIIQKVKTNRISTTEVADCLGKTGVIKGALPLNKGHFRVGPVFFAYAFNQSNWELHEQIQNVPENCIVVVECIECSDRAVLGSLVTKFLFLYRQAAGLAVTGFVRDAPHLIKENWPIWCAGVTPIGCFNMKNERSVDSDVMAGLQQRYDGAIAICDDSGVVIVPAKEQTDEFLAKLDWIEEQEDIWFDCIDRRKWTTYDAVCLKKYRQE